MLPTKKELVDIAVRERLAKFKEEQAIRDKLEHERRCTVANTHFCKLPDMMREAAKNSSFQVIINCGTLPDGEDIAKIIQSFVKAEGVEGLKTQVFYKHETVSNVGFGVYADEPDTREISYWAFRIYW